ncbi:MAG: hypothetical protein CMD13_03425 [Flavobacteriales bacterium]|nr:hypothetical protein [Flavobacteriales bacterium]|tara:strand:- start:601 stop:1197 length:597 start_codon:yes stop_codon:yes gene_type:complete
MVESTKKVIIKILNNPKKLKKDDLKIIKNISENYPFFNPAKILHLLFSKKFKTIDYNNLLRSSSVTSTDRSHLYYVLNNDILNQEEKIDLINELDKESFKQEISFLDWISKTKPTPIKSNFKNDNSFKLNDLKIKKHNHKIKIKRKDYMTETLAKLYIKQEKFEDALKAYKILCLKYPEKISLFADQIKIIKNHIKNK